MTPVSSASCMPFQHQLFGLAFEVDDRTTSCKSCPTCGSSVATVGSGSGPHHARLTCVRGHFLRWLPRPVESIQ
jgi:ribosomal protein S27AE